MIKAKKREILEEAILFLLKKTNKEEMGNSKENNVVFKVSMIHIERAKKLSHALAQKQKYYFWLVTTINFSKPNINIISWPRLHDMANASPSVYAYQLSVRVVNGNPAYTNFCP